MKAEGGFTTERQESVHQWCLHLQDKICDAFEEIERQYDQQERQAFKEKIWERPGGGVGRMRLMRGKVFEKVGVNVSVVHGEITDVMRKELFGFECTDQKFWATGLSLVLHMRSPLVPGSHMNTRCFCTENRGWFGGGADLNPAILNHQDTETFHQAFRQVCEDYRAGCYEEFKRFCDDYFYIRHRKEHRGVGGIFYDHLNGGVWEEDFLFMQCVGRTFLSVMRQMITTHMRRPWTPEQKKVQLVKRGRYAEFNLVYDRGTKFGLLTGADPEAVLMSLPPEAVW